MKPELRNKKIKCLCCRQTLLGRNVENHIASAKHGKNLKQFKLERTQLKLPLNV